MKSIIEYINEDAAKFPLWCDISLSMFLGAKNLTKETVIDMLNSFCDVEGRLKKFSDYLNSKYPKDYIAYQPADDEFLKKENNEKIVSQIAEFIVKKV